MIKKSKKPFTLLEMLVCFTILSLVGGLFAVRGKRLFDQYASKQEVAKLFDILQLAKEYAYCYQCDIEVHFQKNKQYYVEVKTDEPLLKQDALFTKTYTFSKITEIDVENSSVLFSGSGWVFPKKEIIIIGNQQKTVVYL
jgi:hypothetical protein